MMIADDWFDDFDEKDFLSHAKTSKKSSASSSTRVIDPLVDIKTYTKGLYIIPDNLIKTIVDCCGTIDKNVYTCLQYVMLNLFGQRNIRKDPVNFNELDIEQREIFLNIKGILSDEQKKERIFNFINNSNITKRLINYFVIQFSLLDKELSYYLDRRTYPYRVIGEYNNPNQPDILKLISKGENIIWINFYQEYRVSKTKNGCRNRHAPYRRSTSVVFNNESYSLCELNFYIWLDSIGGFDVFFNFEQEIRAKKLVFDEQNRQKRNKPHKKQKTVLAQTDGRNYNSFALSYPQTVGYSMSL